MTFKLAAWLDIGDTGWISMWGAELGIFIKLFSFIEAGQYGIRSFYQWSKFNSKMRCA